MPIFSDLSLYYCGSSTSFSPSYYSSPSYTPRSTAFTGFSSGLSSRLLPLTPRINKYSPLLPTITESSAISSLPRYPLHRISSPKYAAPYRAPKPIDIDTDDIDVTTPRKRDRISRDRDDPQQGTIKRGRTVVRLHTRKLKENPGLINRKKTPGELLVEKFLIKDKAAEEAKRRKIEEEAIRLRHVYKDTAVNSTEEVKPLQNGDDAAAPRRRSIQDCLEELQGYLGLDEEEKKFLAKQQATDDEDQSDDLVSESEALDVLLSESENDPVIPVKRPEPTPDPEPPPDVEKSKKTSVKGKQRKSSEKSGTIKKRPKKREKNATIKKTENKPVEEEVQPPVEKSLLQRRNTVRKNRRNSRDLEMLTLDLSDEKDSKVSTPTDSVTSTPLSTPSVPSTPADSIMSTPAGSTLSTPVPSKPSSPVTSVPSTPVNSAPPTPTFLSKQESFSFLDTKKPLVPKTQTVNRDMFPFKTKVNDVKPLSPVAKKISAEVSIENASDTRKMPLKFVVDEVKVEETPKSPKPLKIFQYEVTVEEVADLSFQKQKSAKPNFEAFSSMNDVSSPLEDITEENETDVEFWDTEDAEAHKLSKLVKNISKFNEKEQEKEDCIPSLESKKKTFPATNAESGNKAKKLKTTNDNKSKAQDSSGGKFKYPNSKTTNATKVKNDKQKTETLDKKEQVKLKQINEPKNETTLNKAVESTISTASEEVEMLKCEAISGVFAVESPKVPLVTQVIPKSQVVKVGQNVDNQILATYPSWGQPSDNSMAKLFKILKESGLSTASVKMTSKGISGGGKRLKLPTSDKKETAQTEESQTSVDILKADKTPEEKLPKVEVISNDQSGMKSSQENDKNSVITEPKTTDQAPTKSIQNLEDTNEKKAVESREITGIQVKEICEIVSVEPPKITEKVIETPKSEAAAASAQKDDQSNLPAWKKALIAKNQASKSKDQIDTQQKSEQQILKTCDESLNNKSTDIPSKINEKPLAGKDEISAQSSDVLSVKDSEVPKKLQLLEKSETSTPKLPEPEPVQSTLDKSKLQLSTGAKPKVQEDTKKQTEKIKSDDVLQKGQKTKNLQKSEESNSIDSKKNSDDTSLIEKPKIVENKIKDLGSKPLSSLDKPKITDSKVAENKQKSTEDKLKALEAQLAKMAQKNVEKPLAEKAKPVDTTSEEKIKSVDTSKEDKSKPTPLSSDVNKVKSPQTSPVEKSPPVKIEEKKKKSQKLVKTKPTDLKLIDSKTKSPELSPVEKTKTEEKTKSADTSKEDKSKPTPLNKLKSPQTSPVEKSPPVNIEEKKQKSQKLVKTKPADLKLIDSKTKSPELSPVEKTKTSESKLVDKPPFTKSKPPILKLTDGKIKSPEKSPVDKTQSPKKKLAEKEGSSKKSKSIENKTKDKTKSPKKSKVEKSQPSETNSSETKPKTSSVGKPKKLKSKNKKDTENEQKPEDIPPPDNKSPVLEKAKPVEKKRVLPDSPPAVMRTAIPKPLPALRPMPRPKGHPAAVDESSSEEETDSEEETETETDDDGEEVTPASQRASTSSEDSGIDSLPTSVPGSPACNKKGPDNKGPSCSSGSSTDSASTCPALSNPGLDPYDDSSPPSTLARAGRVTPPATTIPRFRKYSVEDFQFLKVLGKGSFGKVLLAELKNTECYYAVKCLKKDVVLEDDDVECTLIERKVLALGTKHPYLCHLFCTFQTESHLFFVMEYLNGGDLMFHIQQSGRFLEPRARFYAAEIVSGLKFLHKKGVVYRDLKLDNILLDFDGHVRIADFGMCKLQIYLDRTADTFCGTPDYMAPEIIKGLKYNQSVDWWSFGILLYEMLIGQSPFSGCDEDDLFWSICNEQPHFPRFLSREANSILSMLLEKDSSKRLGSGESNTGDVTQQPFFRSVDWDALERRELEPPFKPRLQHPLDVQYFDKAFTVERAKLTPVEREILQSMDQTQFQGFSYTNPNATD